MTVAATQLDPNFKYEVANQPGGENIKACFACGVCTAGCPVSEIDEKYNPRKIIRMVLLGLREQVLSSDLIWLCSTCYTCYAHCPQDVKFTDVIGALRDMAIKEGYVDPSFKRNIDALDTFAQRVRRDMVLAAVGRKREAVSVNPSELLAQVTRG